ncbi:xanthine dehydrogenase family protein molybdopterin-binding subunit [Novosphingobium album (ex Liu et al. 2023)]|uniref:Xanthine dehydrogenase family protein molybdopterin-binding subunit n=1 Tax=Novosphingobium album (ex Liu et al. 2023) TaxID=3031130 RepID=A0ABT5WP41_9SPHN|nr:xanthine dehydrogenase family protein molybdopterin-binding subunit [Novosphingobium album (ex Liu et al. 2023)]MDE8651042.1 xanthine dehydrogenase family protein molybdopterin-binding subunit [Novosphingobium album (ex Liu et al. 2023)]
MNAPQKQDGFQVVGTRPVRPDGVDKVTGKALYGTDFKAPGMLQGAVLRSPHPHARIRAIDTRKAEALPGVKAVVTGRDFPSLQSLIMAVGESASDIVHVARNCLALDKVLYEGHAVAAVAATSPEIAREAAALIEVDYEVLPHVLGLEEALADDAPLLHDDVFTKGVSPRPDKPSNASMRVEMGKGDVDAALAGAAVVVSGRYTMEPVHQGYIEPHACVASWNADGQAQIWCSSQGHFAIRSLTASTLGIPQADIRVTPLEIGGGFGGKTTVYLEPVAMLLSRKAGRPVRLAMSREDVFRASGPAPGAVIDVRIGADADGMLVAAEVDFKYHSGAYPAITAHSGVSSAVGHYRIANTRLIGWEVLCNRPATKAYRAPGAPQVNFAVESAIDEIAGKLGMDPLELRLKNAVAPGDPQTSGVPFGMIGWIECLEAARAHPHWSAPLGPNQGRGVAGGYWGNYGGPSTASVSLGEDGSVLVTTGSPDIGGSRAAMAIMAAEVLEVPYEKVRCTIADTASIGFSMVTGGSRVTFATGKAVVDAANMVKDTLRERAARMWGVAAADVEWRDGAAHCTGGDKAGESMAIGTIAARAIFAGGPVSAEAAINAAGWLPGFGVHICDTEVDAETGQVRVVRYTAIQDVGRAIHPDYVEGQMQGGAVQGIGWALNETYIYNAQGKLDNPGFLDYRMPVASDVPMIDTVMVEVPNPDHPFGVKGVGEVPIVPPLAAVANAVARATGVRMHDLPLSPDRVYAALHPEG